MEEGFIENRAGEVPFAGILADLLKENLAQHPEKREVFRKMRGGVAIDLADIETAVTLVFEGERLRIEAGVDARSRPHHPDGVRPGDGS